MKKLQKLLWLLLPYGQCRVTLTLSIGYFQNNKITSNLKNIIPNKEIAKKSYRLIFFYIFEGGDGVRVGFTIPITVLKHKPRYKEYKV